MVGYRIADARHSIFDPTGAMLHGGRWNSVGRRVIYAAETFAGAMLEILVHANLSHPPRNHQVVRIRIPDAVRMERVEPNALPGWDSDDVTVARAFGDRWIAERRSALLVVPSVITRGHEHNLVLNVEHPEFPTIQADAPEPVFWDSRLFGSK
jgi:RES domain-containing protein